MRMEISEVVMRHRTENVDNQKSNNRTPLSD